MSLSSERLNEKGEFRCWVCGRKQSISNGENCSLCGHFMCTSCSVNDGHATVCKKCAR